MWMTKTQIADFPKFAAYVEHDMPTCSKVSSIVKNLKKYGSLTDAQVRTALRWGTMPLVFVKDLWDEVHWKADANGQFNPATPYQIDIAKHRVDQFEISWGHQDRTASGRRVYIVGATILHELCHWGNFWGGVAETGDHGKKFERAVYGRDIG